MITQKELKDKCCDIIEKNSKLYRLTFEAEKTALEGLKQGSLPFDDNLDFIKNKKFIDLFCVHVGIIAKNRMWGIQLATCDFYRILNFTFAEISDDISIVFDEVYAEVYKNIKNLMNDIIFLVNVRGVLNE